MVDFKKLNSSWKQMATLTLLAGLAGCGSAPQSTTSSPAATSSSTSAAGEKPVVITTNTVLCDLTKQIAAQTVNLKCLIAPGADPHVYEPTPNDKKAIETASLILYGGYNFEPTLIKLIQATSNAAPKVAVHELAVPNPQTFEEDGKTETDPHVWHNAQNGIQIATVISEKLSQLEPANVQLYTANTQKITAEVGQIDTWIKSQIATIPQSSRKLVTTHDALGYYSKAYNISIEGALQGISTEEAPTPTRVKELVGEIKTDNVPTIFAELSSNPKLIEAVAKEANVKLSEQELYADGLGEPGSSGETYQKMLLGNTEAIVRGLGGQFTPFQPKTSSLLDLTIPQAAIQIEWIDQAA
jgi:ABC-type Zn uptake system ZnuABC Zn-binding protein ZnuA